jgi:hypothetical protein
MAIFSKVILPLARKVGNERQHASIDHWRLAAIPLGSQRHGAIRPIHGGILALFCRPHPMPQYLVVEMIAYVISIAAFPLAMVVVARQFNLSHRYVPLIVAYNWSSVIMLGALTFILALFSLEVFSVMMAGGLMALTMLVWPFYLYAIVKLSTGAVMRTSILLVLTELIVSYFIGTLAAFF